MVCPLLIHITLSLHWVIVEYPGGGSFIVAAVSGHVETEKLHVIQSNQNIINLDYNGHFHLDSYFFKFSVINDFFMYI